MNVDLTTTRDHEFGNHIGLQFIISHLLRPLTIAASDK